MHLRYILILKKTVILAMDDEDQEFSSNDGGLNDTS